MNLNSVTFHVDERETLENSYYTQEDVEPNKLFEYHFFTVYGKLKRFKFFNTSQFLNTVHSNSFKGTEISETVGIRYIIWQNFQGSSSTYG